MAKVIKLLIIGNGFDLAHELPTRYDDFLFFSNSFVSLYSKYIFSRNLIGDQDADRYLQNVNSIISSILKNIFVHGEHEFSSGEKLKIDNPLLKEMYEMIIENYWISYFNVLLNEKLQKGLNWIDFESEISDTIQLLDSIPVRLEDGKDIVVSRLMHYGESNLNSSKRSSIINSINKKTSSRNFENLIDELYDELERVINALNLYLFLFVEKLQVKKLDVINNINTYYLISFNYTHTFENVYNKYADICYIHGECNGGSKTNLVLGIDEYNVGEDKDIKTNMSVFKKFVQRIRNSNDTRYREWVDKWDSYEGDGLAMPKDALGNGLTYPEVDVYIYGHSLGISDKDILSRILKPENRYLKLYPYTKTEEGKLISRLIRIIGEDTLIEKAHHKLKKLEFLSCK